MSSRLDIITDWEELAKDSAFKVRVLARTVGVSSESLRLYVRNRFDVSPRKWLSEMRMREAQRMLVKGKLVKEVADALGFAHPTHFSRAFRMTHGISPRASVSLKSCGLLEKLGNWSGNLEIGPL